ncbi:DUF1223 domain-containing protein [Paracoccus ravus]|uniref:DUF1223 domain-containing protein n=1 Tax=Paracoccus ravus TaxID=2447760 RepID=UPI001FD67CEF|nr:DUF1223 domain-containing protein [Paracoccus ravus]
MLALVMASVAAQPVLAQERAGMDPRGPSEGVASEPERGPNPSFSDSPEAQPEDDGRIGLIEAPEGRNGFRAGSSADLSMGRINADADGVAPAFAERRSAQAREFSAVRGHSPVVVELFTSQGCSSCPPADQMLNDLAAREDILALAWHVDYWDYLGWADEFARPEFTRRQKAYAHAWRERAVYTPQMVVGGTDTMLQVNPAELMALVEAQMARPAPVLVTSTPQPEGFRLELTPRAQIRNGVVILLVRYVPERRIEIHAGENRGMIVTYRNVVLDAERIAEWDGRAPLRMNVTATARASGAKGPDFPPDTRHAILAQEAGPREGRATGPILAAIRLD